MKPLKNSQAKFSKSEREINECQNSKSSRMKNPERKVYENKLPFKTFQPLILKKEKTTIEVKITLEIVQKRTSSST